MFYWKALRLIINLKKYFAHNLLILLIGWFKPRLLLKYLLWLHCRMDCMYLCSKVRQGDVEITSKKGIYQENGFYYKPISMPFQIRKKLKLRKETGRETNLLRIKSNRKHTAYIVKLIMYAIFPTVFESNARITTCAVFVHIYARTFNINRHPKTERAFHNEEK